MELILTAATVAAGAGVVLAAMQSRGGAATPVYGYEVVQVFPHDRQAFTQGLVYHEGFLYEGTGQNGQSTIRKVRLENGEVLQVKRNEARHFGEGIAIVGPSLVQLTWQSGVGFVYDLATFDRKQTFSYKGEGWGLAYDGTRLVMSDGTPALRFLDPATFKETKRVVVKDGGVPVEELNELEFVKGELFANIWNVDRIARIATETGEVTGWIDMRGLLSARDAKGVDVLNGIAYDAAGDRLFVTGKLWPKLFEIKIVPKR
jgi:glutaminyl-peptide cyclotransferase